MRWLALASWLLALWGAAAAAFAGQPPSSVALLVAVAFLPYGWLVAGGEVLETRTLIALALAVGVPMLLAPVVLSDDVYRYLWDARVVRAGLDPYLYAPADPALRPLRDALWRHVNHPEVPTIYPPGAQLVFAAADTLGHAPWSPRLLMLGVHLGLIPLLQRRAPGWPAMAWALNPLAIEESALGGHIDVLVGAALLGALLALEAKRTRSASLLLLVASGLKLVGVLLAPLVGRERRAFMVPVLLVAALPILPLVGAGAGSDTTGGLGQYARRWRGNEGLYGVAEASIAAVLAEVGQVSAGRVRLDAARPLFAALDGTWLDPRASFLPEKKPIADVAEFELHVLSAVLTRALLTAGAFALAFVLGWRRVAPLVAGRMILWTALLVAPQMHPWYLLWLLPLDLADRRVSGLVWSAAILVAYAPLDAWVTRREWHEVGQCFQYALVIAAVLAEAWSRRGQPRAVGAALATH